MIKREWRIFVEPHAIEQWRKRYDDKGTDEEIRQKITKRILVGVGSLFNYTIAQIKAIARPEHKRSTRDLELLAELPPWYMDRDEDTRMAIGDLTFAFRRIGTRITVKTILCEGGYTLDATEPFEVAHAKRLERRAGNRV